MTVLAVVPARMGSARMPRKNLCEIKAGLSLIQQAVDCANHSGVIDEVVVSSDDRSLAAIIAAACFVNRPAEISGPNADIVDAVKHATEMVEQVRKVRYDYVVTLQPAVVARSPLIVRRLVEAVTTQRLEGGLTMAATHRWIWQVGGELAMNDWHGRPYPRSQDSAPRRVEINAVQIASRAVVHRRERWGVPLAILELPAWAAALDIDTPEDLAEARALWPWAWPRLETWTGRIDTITEVQSSCV